MKRFIFAVAVACLFAANSFAADPPATTTTPPVVTGTTVTATTTPTVMTTTGSTTARRIGLFARMRNRSGTSAYTTAPVITSTPATPMPGTIVPTPMPKPITTGGTTGVVTTGGTTVVDGTMMPMMTPGVATTAARVGLMSRLRMRRAAY